MVGPVRTSFGYHIIKVGETRPAQGGRGSHIMLRRATAMKPRIKHWFLKFAKSWIREQRGKTLSNNIRKIQVRKTWQVPPIRCTGKIPEFDAARFSKTPVSCLNLFKPRSAGTLFALKEKSCFLPLEESAPALKQTGPWSARTAFKTSIDAKKPKRDYAFECGCQSEKVLALADSTLTKRKMENPRIVCVRKGRTDYAAGKENNCARFSGLCAAKSADEFHDRWQIHGTSLQHTYAESMLSEAFEAKLIATNPEFEMLFRRILRRYFAVWHHGEGSLEKGKRWLVGQRGFFEGHPELYKAGERVRATIHYSDLKRYYRPVGAKQILGERSARSAKSWKQKMYSEVGTFQREDRPAPARYWMETRSAPFAKCKYVSTRSCFKHGSTRITHSMRVPLLFRNTKRAEKTGSRPWRS